MSKALSRQVEVDQAGLRVDRFPQDCSIAGSGSSNDRISLSTSPKRLMFLMVIHYFHNSFELPQDVTALRLDADQRKIAINFDPDDLALGETTQCLQSRGLDVDARLTLAMLRKHTQFNPIPVDDSAARILSHALKLSRSPDRRVITAGPAALHAGTLGMARVMHVVSVWPTWWERVRLTQLQQSARLRGVIVHATSTRQMLILSLIHI